MIRAAPFCNISSGQLQGSKLLFDLAGKREPCSIFRLVHGNHNCSELVERPPPMQNVLGSIPSATRHPEIFLKVGEVLRPGTW